MPIPPRLDAALQRLASALDQLEAAGARRAQADAQRADLEEELSVMQDDRSRLAVELDGALARNRSLQTAHNEVRQRLANVSEAVRSLAPFGEPEPEA
jgi:chromosome segregation ATPase